jgi:hypothetical protein
VKAAVWVMYFIVQRPFIIQTNEGIKDSCFILTIINLAVVARVPGSTFTLVPVR